MQIQSAVSAFQAGQMDDARRKAEAVLAQAPGQPMASQVLAMVMMRAGQDAAAIDVLRRAEQEAPNDPQLKNILGAALNQAGRKQDALVTFKEAVAIDGKYLDPLLNLANLETELERRAEAKTHYDAALMIQAGHPMALSGLARLAVMASDADKALRLADQALAGAGGHAPTRLIKAQALVLLGRFEEAAQAAQAVLQTRGIGPDIGASALTSLAEAAAGLKRYDDAFRLFEQANATERKVYGVRFDDAEAAARLETFDTFGRLAPPLAEKARSWAAELTGPAPVFLVGFPRSGTTLLERVLSAHPDIVSIEEKEPFNLATGLNADWVAARTRVADWTLKDAQDIRARYWDEVAKLGLGDLTGKIVLDKLPLYTQQLPLIAAVFPDAKILFALRDPRDVVLSCLQQRFTVNRAMFEFLSLDRAAKHYDRTMTVAVAARESFDLNLLDVRYEDVVADLEGAARKTLAFLELEWHADVLAYRDTLKQRATVTPSARQVSKPIYTTSVAKWRNYEKSLASVRSVLDPWATQWGYDT